MKDGFAYSVFVYAMCLLLSGCVKPYEPDELKYGNSYLVVDGVINATPNERTIIQLSRTKKLNDTVSVIPENFAQVTIESNTGAFYPLTATGKGVYISGPLQLNATGSHRLNVYTNQGIHYVSEFVEVTPNPPIDSLNWKQEGDDITVFLTTHNNQNSTRYYRWEYMETWEYHAEYETIFDFQNGQIVFRDTNNYIYKCWDAASSSNVLLHTTAGISEDLVREFPIVKQKVKTEKLAIRYSINVKQYGLTKLAYEYWLVLRKNTEELGNIFDAQPSQLFGNITNTANPGEPVIGYVTASPVTEKRLFIKREALTNGYAPVSNCPVIVVQLSDAPALIRSNPLFAPAYGVTGGGIAISTFDCVDCRRKGGTTIKPSYWP